MLERSQRSGINQQPGGLPPTSVKGCIKSAVFYTHPGHLWPEISKPPTGHDFSFPLILPDCEMETDAGQADILCKGKNIAHVLQNTQQLEAAAEVDEMIGSVEGKG